MNTDEMSYGALTAASHEKLSNYRDKMSALERGRRYGLAKYGHRACQSTGIIRSKPNGGNWNTKPCSCTWRMRKKIAAEYSKANPIKAAITKHTILFLSRIVALAYLLYYRIFNYPAYVVARYDYEQAFPSRRKAPNPKGRA